MKVKKLLSAIIAGAMVLGTMSFPAFAADSVGVEYNGTTYASFAEARNAVASDATEITYTIHGKVILPSGYINDITGSAASAETLNFKAADGDVTAELALEGTGANIIGLDLIGAVKTVNYENLILSRTNGSWIPDIGHANNYFTTAMRGVSDGIVNYKNCTFPNGSCNNFYNKTTYTNCKFHNDSEYGLWIYGGETEVTGATFTGAKGVQAYSEDVNADVTTKITNSTFNGITKKPAIISGTKGTVTLENITTDNCVYGLLQTKPKDGNSNLPYAEVTVDGKEPSYVAKVGSSVYTNQAFAEKEAESQKTTVLPIVAKVNGQFYSTLAEAVAAAENGDTVKLLADASGNGVVVPSGSNITIDLGGYTYNVDGTTVGSTGTETNGFQLLKNSNITIKNGTITSEKAKILIQNYSNLTLEDVTLDGSKLVGSAPYTLSNNCGNTVLKGDTNIIAKDGGYAFDCYYWPSNGYTEGVTVTLGTDFTGKITGKIEMTNDGTDTAHAATKQSISISGGTFTTDVRTFLADGYKLTTNEDGTYGVVVETATHVAQIGEAKYTSLADAIAAAQTGDTVKLLTNASGNGIKIPSGSNITIDLGGFTYNVDGTTVGSSGTETNGFQLLKDSNITFKNGTITSNKAKILIQNYSNLTLENVTLDGSNLPGTNRYVLSNNNGNTVLTGNTNIIAKEGDVAFDVCRYANYPSVTVTLDENMTGTIKGNIELSDSADSSTVGAVDADRFNLIIKAGTVNGAINDLRSATQKNHADFGKISGGTFTTDVSAFLADGYKLTTNEGGTFGVVAEEETKPEILKNSLYVTYSELGKFDFGRGEVDSIRLSLFAGVDSLNYSEVGFDVTLNGVTQTFPVTVVYDSVKTNMNGEVKTVKASEFGNGVNHIFGYTINFPATAEFDNASVKWVPYAIRNKEKITGKTFELSNLFPGTLEVSK